MSVADDGPTAMIGLRFLDMELIVPQHAAAQADERGVTFEEIERTIQDHSSRSRESQFRNEVYSDDVFEVVFDVDGDDRIASIDILDASKRVNLAAILAVERTVSSARAS